MTEVLYLDSSAIVKLVLPERETAALVDRLGPEPHAVSSALAQVEVVRALRRIQATPSAWRQGEEVLARVALLRIDEAILGDAAAVDPPSLRSLDAIHLATAFSIGDELTGLVTYDSQLADAAERAGIEALTPS